MVRQNWSCCPVDLAGEVTTGSVPFDPAVAGYRVVATEVADSGAEFGVAGFMWVGPFVAERLALLVETMDHELGRASGRLKDPTL